MAIISNPNNLFCENHFVFIGNDILVKKDSVNQLLEKNSLPDEETLRKCLENQIASDWFAEPELDYSAMMLEKDSAVPAGLKAIPLRQFFWDSKSDDEKNDGVTSALSGLASRAHGFLRLREQYRFCPTCGGKLTDDAEAVARKCMVCGRQLFPRIEPAVIVLVRKGNEVLLAKNKNRTSDIYSCIAGFVEHGETAEQCVQREVMEETGIKVKNIKYVGSQPWPFPDQLMLAFTAEYESGKIKIQQEELDEAAWFKEDCLPAITKPGSVAFNLIKGYF